MKYFIFDLGGVVSVPMDIKGLYNQIDYEKFSQNFDTSVFDEMFLSYKLGMLKPDDNIYQYVINKLKASPEDIYFFDDNKENVDSAIRNGIQAYQVTRLNIKEKISEILESF